MRTEVVEEGPPVCHHTIHAWPGRTGGALPEAAAAGRSRAAVCWWHPAAIKPNPLPSPFPRSARLPCVPAQPGPRDRATGEGTARGGTPPQPDKRPNPAAGLPTLRTGAMKTETPIRMKTARPVSLCSLRAPRGASRVPRGPSRPRGPCLPSRPPGSLLVPAAMVTGGSGSPHPGVWAGVGASPRAGHPPERGSGSLCT